MYYRRKILLAILQIFGEKLDRRQFQKLLFLFSKLQQKADFHFIPFKFGCFSYQANYDLSILKNQTLIKEHENEWEYIGQTDFISTLKEKDKQALTYVKMKYKNMSADELIKYTYIKYPYFAINSTIANQILTNEEYDCVIAAKPVGTRITLFTIGYEGISLEEYINKLLKNDIKLLVDVRNNAISMKYGFSKNLLKSVCNNVGIEYLHFPEVGIISEQRQALSTQKDYDMLFDIYKKENLTRTTDTQQTIFQLLIKHNRIALTCFEANICQCHRKHLAESITKLSNWSYELKHI